MAESKSTPLASRLGALVKAPRSRRYGLWFGGLLLAFGLFGYFAAPPLLKSVLLQQLSKELQREVSIERIDISPYALSARVAGFSVKAGDGHEVVGFDELFVNLSSASLFKFAAVVDEVRLQGPRVAVARVADGRYDISDLLDKWMQPKDEPESGTPRFSLNNIKVADGRIVFDDQPKGKVHTVSELNFTLPFVSSLPYQAEIFVEPSFSAAIDGSTLALKGRSTPFHETHHSELDLDLDRFDLSSLQPYLPEALPLAVASGRLDSELKAVFQETAGQVYSLTVVGAAHIDGLALTERGGAPLLGWKRLDVELDSLDPLNRKADVKRVALDGIDVNLAVDRQGRLNWLRVAERAAAAAGKAPAAAEPAPAPAAPFAWSLGEFALNEGRLRWHDDSNAPAVAGEVRQLKVHVGKLDSRLAAPLEIGEVSGQLDFGDALRVDRLALQRIRVDLAAQRADVGELATTGTRGRMLRERDGRLVWLAAPVLAAQAGARHAAKSGKAPAAKPWIARLDKLKMDDIGFRFEDRSLRPAAVQELDGFSLSGEGLGNEPGKHGSLRLAGKVNKKGSLKVEGSVRAQPLDLALKVETVAVPLLPLQPYFGQYLNVALTRGQVSNQGEASVKLERNQLKAAYKGSLTLGDLLAVDRLNSADFLKWKSLYLGGIDFRLEPLSVAVGEIALSDFYSRLILNKEGRLNLADLVRKDDAAVPPDAAKPADTKTAAAEPAKVPPPIRIGKITLQNGTVNFSDFFVQPNYSVNLTKLGGRVTGLSSKDDTVADLELRGSYANSAPVQITAKLNPLAAKSYLDLKAEVSGVDLVGFTPYAGKYAGYAIEKGKLSMNVAYRLENRQLSADNRLFIDQFTFGDRIESPDATKLPVNLAISLLKNNRGEIDLNLPISGSLEDPQFSVGGLIVKVIVNLFVKAVTSPFALLGSMFGGGEELSNVEFGPGRSTIDAAATHKLETLAKALTERASLKLEITGRADPVTDKEGIKRVAIERAMQAEKLKDMLKKGGEGVSVDSIVIPPAEYETYLTRAYKAAKFPKPRNMIGLQKDLPVEEMEKLMLANLPAGDDEVRALAQQRAETVQAWLVEHGKVPLERLFLLPPETAPDDKAKGHRVDFSLR